MRAFTGTLLVAAISIMLSRAPDARAQDAAVPLPAADQAVLDAKLGAGVVGEPLPSAPLGDASVYFPMQASTRSYDVTNGANAGETIQLAVARVKRPNGTPAWRFQLSPTIAAYLRQTSPGDLVLSAMTDTEEGLVIVTTPANPFLVKGMKPGESRNLSQTVSINYLDDPSDQKYSGSLDSSFTYLGTYRVTVPAGTYDAVLMRHKHTGKVGPADTQDTAYYLLAPGVGVVAMISQEDIEAFWILHIDTSTGKVLASAQ